MQPRNEPGRPLRMTITPARHDWQAGGLALHEGLMQRDERPEMTRKPRPAALTAWCAVAAEGDRSGSYMLWPVFDTSRLPVRQRGQVGVRSRLNSPKRRSPV